MFSMTSKNYNVTFEYYHFICLFNIFLNFHLY